MVSIIRIFLISLAVLLFTACGGENRREGRTTIRFSFWAAPTQEPAFQRAKERFEELHPGVRVQLINIPWSQYNNQLVTMAAGRSSPDIVLIDRIWASEMMSRGAFADISSFVGNDPDFDLDDFAPGINDYFRQDDGLHGLMAHYSVLLLLYNKDLFDEEGIGYPDGNWTWDDLEEAALRLSKDRTGNGVVDQFGTSLPVAEYATMSSFIWQNGGGLWDPSSEHRVTGPEAVEAIDFLMRLMDARAQPTPAQMQTSDTIELFKSSRLATMLTWPSGIVDATTGINFEAGTTVLPMGKVRATYGGGPAYAISESSSNKEIAWEFMKFLLGEETQLDMARVGMVMPTRNVDRESLLAAFPNQDVIEAYYASLPHARSIPRLRNLNRVMSTFMERMEEIAYKTRPREAALRELDQYLREHATLLE